MSSPISSICDPANGFLSMTLPTKGGAELALKIQ
jgi:hypothetical protein